jgi:lysophospholipase L1-like esterase
MLSKMIIQIALVILILTGFFGYGVAVGVFKIFPYQQIYQVKEAIKPNPYADRIGRNREHRVKLFEMFSATADVVFIWDSITAAGEWSEFFPLMRTANRGVGSDQSSDVLLRLESIYSVKPKIAFLMMGINDIHSDVSMFEILTNYSSIISLLRQRGILVVVQSTIQCQIEVCGQENILEVNQLNRKLEIISQDFNVTFLHLGELSSENGLAAQYTNDGIHLTAFGYRIWVEKIHGLIASL